MIFLIIYLTNIFFSIADVPDDRLLVLNTVNKIAYTHTHTHIWHAHRTPNLMERQTQKLNYPSVQNGIVNLRSLSSVKERVHSSFWVEERVNGKASW